MHPETNQEQYLGKTMAEININTDTCIMCGKCTQVCPPHIFMQREKKTPIRVFKPERWIDCGHCVDVCPTHSIEHSNIPYEKVHKIDYKDMPTPEQLMNLLHARRSNRTFTDRTIQDSAFEQIIEAGYYAPTAVNNRQVKITLLKDADQLLQVKQYVMDTFLEMAAKMKAENNANEGYYNAAMLEGLVKSATRGRDTILRGCSAILVFTSNHDMGIRDCQLAYQNSSLMAQALGISQVYLGYVLNAYTNGDQKKLEEIMGVTDHIQAVMALGIPAFRYTNYTER